MVLVEKAIWIILGNEALVNQILVVYLNDWGLKTVGRV
jgi:hypothetical protein